MSISQDTVLSLNFHSFGQILLHSWAYTADDPEDLEDLVRTYIVYVLIHAAIITHILFEHHFDVSVCYVGLFARDNKGMHREVGT